ncbi:MAG: DUF5317 domain-containing protein [Anaerolineales bacterium]|jgi:lysylphosphatidylglycerol synthetase-like protein (DUF2156 family)
MQFMIVPVLAAGLIAMLRGGQLKNLAALELRFAWLPLAMFAVQFGFVLFPLGEGELYFRVVPWITVSTYALLIAFLALNRELPGLKLILLGAALNLAVILANGGCMPVNREALVRSGHLDKVFIQGDRAYVLGSKDIVLDREDTRLQVLSDVLKVPGALEVPATFSIGDVLIMVGASWLAYRALLDGTHERREQEQDWNAEASSTEA